MKHLRKRLLALLALTLFGAGAWAQGPTTVFEVDFSSTPTATTGSMWISNYVGTSTIWIHNNMDQIHTIQLSYKHDYSQKYYFSIKPETGSFQTGDTLLIAMSYNSVSEYTVTADIYAADGTTLLFTTAPGINGYNESGDPVVEKFVLEQDADSLLIVRSNSSNSTSNHVTTLKVLRPGGDAIELTKVGANQWTLGQTPDYDVELLVEYYEPHALKNIPQGWSVAVDSVDKTSAIVGDSLLITETALVTLTPDNPRRIKSVTLVAPPVPQFINIDGVTLDVTGCTTWSEIIARNPGVVWVEANVVVGNKGFLITTSNSNLVLPSSTYTPPSGNYGWQQS